MVKGTEMQKAASMASMLVLFFPLAVLIFGLSTRKICLILAHSTDSDVDFLSNLEHS